jgi:hypothetical protein
MAPLVTSLPPIPAQMTPLAKERFIAIKADLYFVDDPLEAFVSDSLHEVRSLLPLLLPVAVSVQLVIAFLVVQYTHNMMRRYSEIIATGKGATLKRDVIAKDVKYVKQRRKLCAVLFVHPTPSWIAWCSPVGAVFSLI